MSANAAAVYNLAPGVQTWPLDVSTGGDRYLVEVGSERRFEVTVGVHQVIELLREQGRSSQEIAADLQEQGYVHATPERIAGLVQKVLLPRGIVSAPPGHELPAEHPRPTKPESYLRVKFPLLSPETVLPAVALMQPFFSRVLMLPMLLLIAAAHVFFYWNVFPTVDFSLTQIPSSQYLWLTVLLNVTALLHELGHAAACRYFGCSHGRIGWGIYLFMPVLYTDVTAAWRLPRKQRLLVDFAGMYFEMLAATAALALYLWNGNQIFVYLFLFLNLSLVGSLNPVLRRDGYWLLADLTGQPHLRQASLEAMRGVLARLLRRPPAPARWLARSPSWARWTIYIYSVVSLIFTAQLMGWMGQRIVVDVLPGLPGLASTVLGGFDPRSPNLLAAIDALVRLVFSLLFAYFVISLAWKTVASVLGWLRSLILGTKPGRDLQQGARP